MPRRGANQSRAAAAAVMGATPGDLLDLIIERAETARDRYLTPLPEPQLRTYSRHPHLMRLSAIDLRLENLRAQRQAGKRPV